MKISMYIKVDEIWKRIPNKYLHTRVRVKNTIFGWVVDNKCPQVGLAPGGFVPREGLSPAWVCPRVGLSSGVNVSGGSVPGWVCPGRVCPREALSRVGLSVYLIFDSSFYSIPPYFITVLTLTLEYVPSVYNIISLGPKFYSSHHF